MLRKFLPGRPFGHPLHPALVHFPIGLFSLSLLADVLDVLGPADPSLTRGANSALALGLLLSLPAVVTGLVDRADIRADHPARRIAAFHMLLNLGAVFLFAVSLGLRLQPPGPGPAARLPVLLSGIGVLDLFVSGYLGGAMIYAHGVAVGRQRRTTARLGETVRVPAGAAGGGLTPVARASALREGQALRVEVGGTAMAIVSADGGFFAVQDFCTHRYGPLSEGCVEDGQVTCPWHRSRFHLTTGRVTQGPARVDLRTFEVVVRDGRLYIRMPPEARPEERRAA